MWVGLRLKGVKYDSRNRDATGFIVDKCTVLVGEVRG